MHAAHTASFNHWGARVAEIMLGRFRQSDVTAMNDDIPFDKHLDLAPDVVDEPMPGVRRIMANNPGPFTFKGTVSYIIGRGKVAIVDPGPDDPAHIGALLDAVRNETVTHIFVTHTHRDHSPAVPAIKEATGATVFAEGPHRAARPLHIGELNPLDASADRDFRPDLMLRDVDCRSSGGSDERLYGFIGEALATLGGDLPAGPRAGHRRRTALRQLLHSSSQGPRGFDPASPVEGCDGYSDHRSRDIYRHRSAADGCRRAFRSCAS